MNILRINQSVVNSIRSDLTRPHEYAYERVGFLFCRQGLYDNGLLLLATSYESVPDNLYVNNPTVGAKIGTHAIRNVMQRVMDTGENAFHVHMHEHCGLPRFSTIDRRSLLALIPSFQKVGITTVHGAVLFSLDQIVALIWMPGANIPVFANRIAIVGFPMAIFG